MIKRILVALDPDGDTPVATHYAIDLAKRFGAEVTGLAVIDTRHIAAEVGPGGAIGGLYYAEQVKERLSNEARAIAKQLTDSFHASLAEIGIRHGERIEEGVPYQRIIEDMKYHDLLIMDSTPHFHYDRPKQETNTLERVVKRGVAPTLVVGARYQEVKRVVLAFDSSDPAARTLQRFAQLRPFGNALQLNLVHVVSSESKRKATESELLLRLASSFLHAHGFDRVEETSRNGGTPAERIVDHALETGADLIVAGAHSVSAASRLAFGSTTRALLKNCTVPLFLFH
jgi:nucleotide-binding universal stress UspA family protein